MFIYLLLSWLVSFMAVKTETPVRTAAASLSATSRRTSATITSSASLSCGPGSTVLVTTECTYGHTYSVCHSPPATIVCSDGYYPSVWYPVRCFSASTCYPLPTSTTKCERNGFTAYSTYTAFSGVLNNGVSTVIEHPQCACSGHVSWAATPYASYCLPTGSCADYFIPFSSTFVYTVSGSVVSNSVTSCNCRTSSTPFYQDNKVITCAPIAITSSIPSVAATVTTCP